MRIVGNNYYTESEDKSGFYGRVIGDEFVEDAFDFAYGMTYGRLGQHRANRTNGRTTRDMGEIFCNTFQGKLSEYVVRNSLANMNLNVGEVDTEQEELGRWDSYDLDVEGSILSIKSCKYFSEFLFLETGDYDYYGNYRHSNVQADFLVLVKISPVCQSIMKNNRMLYGTPNEEKLRNMLLAETWKYDIVGFITHDMLVECIQNNQIIPQRALLNGKTSMDAENYYYASGLMIPFDDIGEYLNE